MAKKARPVEEQPVANGLEGFRTSDYDAEADMQSLRKELGLTDDRSASEVMGVLWAKISAAHTPQSSAISVDVERAARALCQHMGDAPDHWMNHVSAVRIVLQAAKPPSKAV